MRDPRREADRIALHPPLVVPVRLPHDAGTHRDDMTIGTPGAMSIRFEIAPPGAPNEFKPYITASARKKR